jgi:hypothetical protein
MRAGQTRALLLVCAAAGWLVATAATADPPVARARVGFTATARSGLARLPAALQTTVSSSLGAEGHEFAVTRTRSGGLVAAGGGISTVFGRGGATVRAAGASLNFGASAIGYGRALAALGTLAPQETGNQVSYRHGAIREWYRNGPLGLEQGFTLGSRPADPHGWLTVSERVSGGLLARRTGAGIVFVRPGDGQVVFRYADLRALDAVGRSLPAVLQLRGADVLLRIDDQSARYPLAIDPIVQQGADLAPSDESGGGEFGATVAVSADGNTALIGAPTDDNSMGAVWVFVRSGSAWTQLGPKLTAPNESGPESFGASLALSSDGDTALIGSGPDVTAGGAWIFTRTGADWTEQWSGQAIGGTSAPAGEYPASFGQSVALSGDGDTAIVSAPSAQENANSPDEQGAAYIFTQSGGVWSQQGTPVYPPDFGGAFGSSVALSSDGDTALIGEPGNDQGFGAAWVYTRAGSIWSEQGTLLAPSDAIANDRVGTGVALDGAGDTALIGSDTAGAWVFTRSGTTWTQQGAVLAGEHGGFSVALSSDGDVAAIDTFSQGDATIYTLVNSQWTELGVSPQGDANNTNAWTGVALDGAGDTLLVGDPADNRNAGVVLAFGVTAVAVPTLIAGSPPAISGTPDQGQQLLASTGSWTNDPTSYVYQWERCDSSPECVPITGATNPDYTLTAADVGDTVEVVVTAVNAGGSGSPATSAAFPSTGEVQVPLPPSIVSAPAVSGILNPGQVLTATDGSWNNDPTSFAYQWEDCNSSGQTCSDIRGATGQSYTLGAADVNAWPVVEVTAQNAGGDSTAASSPIGMVVVPPAPVNTSLPTILGTPADGDTLVESHGEWENNPVSYTYQWQDCAAAGSCTPIAGATGQSYTLTDRDVGDTVRVLETALNAGGQTVATSAPIGAVAASVPVNEELPTISGVDTVGQTLVETNGFWVGSPTSYTYTWEDCDPSGAQCVTVPGATAQSYVLAPSDVGRTIRVQETAWNADGPGTPVMTVPTNAVLPLGPASVLPPTISGTAVVGDSLVEAHGAWSSTPLAYSYQWEDCDGQGGNCVGIAGATAQNYTLTTGDAGHTVEVEETAVNLGGISTPASSTPTEVVVSAPAVSVPARQSMAFSGSVDPEGLPTTAHFEYGLDPKYSGGGAVVYDQSTPTAAVGSDFDSYPVQATVAGLVPNALYHVRLVASNPAGTTVGPDQTFVTRGPGPAAPVIGQTVDLTPLSGVVLIKAPAGPSPASKLAIANSAVVKDPGFVHLSSGRQVPMGSEIDVRHGTLMLTAASASGGEQTAIISGALVKASQTRSGRLKGLMIISLSEGAFRTAPGWAICRAHPGSSTQLLQTLRASDVRGALRTQGRYSSSTGTRAVWETSDRCDGTLTSVIHGTVKVTDFRLHKTIVVHARGSYLAAPV